MKVLKVLPSTPKVCHYNYNMAKQWYVHFRMNDPITGKRHQFRFYGGINYYKNKAERLAEAKALCAATKDKLKEGWTPFPSIDRPEYVNIKDAMQQITKLQWESLRERTMHTYEVVIAVFYKWLDKTGYNDYSHSEFDYKLAQQYMDYLSTKQKITGRTWNNHLAFMKIFFNYLVNRELIEKNPFRKIKKQAQSKSVRNYAFTDAEFTKLNTYTKMQNRQLYYFNMFIYYGALRQKEISMLKVRDIDFVNRNIFINADVSKNKKSESVVITDNFMEIIKEMKIEGWPTDWYIFSHEYEVGPERNTNFEKSSKRTKEYIRKLKINEDCTQYSYKHTGVIRLYYATGHNIQAVSQHCRHYSIVVTQNYMKSLGFVDNVAVRNAVF